MVPAFNTGENKLVSSLMKKLSAALFIFAFVLPLAGVSQVNAANENFTYLTSATGDLNADKIPDSVVVLQDTLNDKVPYRLQIFIAKQKGVYGLYLQSDTAINAKYPDGKDAFRDGVDFSGIEVKNGALRINVDLTRGHYSHKFRYKNGAFALIGFSEAYSDGQGVMTTTDYNLSTGEWREVIERYDTNKLLSKKNKKRWVRPLPDLKTFRPFASTLY